MKSNPSMKCGFVGNVSKDPHGKVIRSIEFRFNGFYPATQPDDNDMTAVRLAMEYFLPDHLKLIEVKRR